MIQIEAKECAVCEKCIPACPKGLIVKKGFSIKINEGCNHCGDCINICPLGAIYFK